MLICARSLWHLSSCVGSCCWQQCKKCILRGFAGGRQSFVRGHAHPDPISAEVCVDGSNLLNLIDLIGFSLSFLCLISQTHSSVCLSDFLGDWFSI